MNGGRVLRTIASVALVGFVAGVLTGVIPLPDLERWLLGLGPGLGDWAYALVGGLAFLETAAFVGLAVPGEVSIVFGGFVAGQGVIELVPLILIVWACAVAGDVLSYWLGRRLGRGFALRHGRRFGVTAERLERVERFFDRHGGKTILIGRFIGFLRSLAPFVAGMSNMPLRPFLVWDVVGGGLWAAALCTLGYVFWQSFERLLELVGHAKLGLLVLVGVAVVLAVLRQLRRDAPPDPAT